jgi:hypothetical protein
LGSLKDMDSISGKMGTHTKVHSKMVSNMEMVSGKSILRREANLTFTRATILWIKRMDGDISNGRAVTHIEVDMLMTKERDLEK